MNALEELLSDLKDVCAGLVDKRQGQTCRYTMADIGLAAFSVLFMQSPSFLAHQRVLAAGHGRSNCQTLLGMSAIPSDNHIRQMLDGNTPAAFDGLFVTAMEAVAAAGGLSTFQRLDGRVLIALDGTEHFCSRKIGCPQCSHRRRSDGGVEYFHSFLAASLVAPGHTQVLPLMPEFITPQDGAAKQDCERAAAKRWLARHGTHFAGLRPVYLGDDLYACQPIASAIRDTGGNFIVSGMAFPRSRCAVTAGTLVHTRRCHGRRGWVQRFRERRRLIGAATSQLGGRAGRADGTTARRMACRARPSTGGRGGWSGWTGTPAGRRNRRAFCRSGSPGRPER